ncbi:MAG: molybdenum cofactor guanylyltransferase, partial [Anaerolineales bacterium]|nr:molybdenum cofactor guanylyltransferase [Anaerolineales bacterium]
MMTNVTIAINAGGKSSRMGTDKSFIPFGGKPLIEHIIKRVRPLADELILITNKPDAYRYLKLPIFGDIYPEHGPLAGIHTAVTHATHPHTLIVACDMPWLNPDLLTYMIAQRKSADIIVPRWGKFPEPLHAIYSKACLPAIEENLKAKRLKIIGFYGKVAVKFIETDVIQQFDANGRSFANINTSEDLERERLNQTAPTPPEA